MAESLSDLLQLIAWVLIFGVCLGMICAVWLIAQPGYEDDEIEEERKRNKLG